MRKIVLLLFVMMMFSFLAVPAFAQTSAAAAGFDQLGSHHFWLRHRYRGGLGGAGSGARGILGMRSARTQSSGARWHPGGADSGSGLHRVAGVVHARDYFRESRLVAFVVLRT